MSATLTAKFGTRREAEMTVERLVQEYDVERSAIFVAAAGNENTSGEDQAGSDVNAGEPSPEAREDAPLRGTVSVSADIKDDAKAAAGREAFGEFQAVDVSGS